MPPTAAFTWIFIVCFGMGILAKIEIHAHRGNRSLHPENTLPAFQSAIETGADYLEMDLAVTKDLVLVVSHDPHIQDILIHNLTFEELKQYNCGSVPILQEVFELVRNSNHPNAKKIKFNIETKIFSEHPEYTVDAKLFSQLVIKVFQESGFLDRIVLQSFIPDTLVESKLLEPSLRISLLIDDPNIDMIQLGQKIQANIISPDYKLLNAELVKQMHQNGFEVIPWTANSEQEWLKLSKMGVDGIITDYPERAIHYLKSLE
ncbi:MAG: hypothetical protein JKY15_07120 [Deltaproteobacteria bacterium]|nr:hypothetical protein [Deltaproteobacteria bacterium]